MVLVPVLKAIYDEIFKKEELSERMKVGMIKMIYKKEEILMILRITGL